MNAQPQNSLVAKMASARNIEPQQFYATIAATVMPKAATREQIASFLMVADRYGLDPLTRQVFAFPTKAGGIAPVVSIDGWIHLVNTHPQFGGMEFTYQDRDDGLPLSVTCTIWRKDRERATAVTEYYAECVRNTEAWNLMPHRMLRHKSLKECARYAFGFSGIYDQDEARELGETVATIEHEIPPADLDAFAAGVVETDFAAAAEAGAVLQQKPSPSQESPAATPQAIDAGEGSGESPSSPPRDDDHLAAAAPADSDARDQAIAEALRIAARGDLDVDGRLEELDLLRMDLLDRLPGADAFIRNVMETAARVASKKLKKDDAQKYLAGLKE
jgi:phage recombination protein Bet